MRRVQCHLCLEVFDRYDVRVTVVPSSHKSYQYECLECGAPLDENQLGEGDRERVLGSFCD